MLGIILALAKYNNFNSTKYRCGMKLVLTNEWLIQQKNKSQKIQIFIFVDEKIVVQEGLVTCLRSHTETGS